MQKKFLFGLLLFSIITSLCFTLTFATDEANDSMKKAANSVRNVVGDAENSIENPEDIKEFKRLGYVFRPDLSSETEYIFERKIETMTR